MTAEINELFEEGITRCRELTDAADEAMHTVDDVTGQAEDLALRIDDEGREACQHMRQLASRLEQAEGELEAGRGQAEGSLEGLGDAAEELAAEMADMLARLMASLQDLESRRDDVDDALDTQAGDARQAFQELSGQTQDVQARAEHCLQQAADAIADFRGAIQAARAELAQKHEAWAIAAATLETAAQEHAQSWVAGLSALLEHQQHCMVQAANAVVDEHNAAMDELRRRFADQAPEDLTRALAPLEEGVDHLGEHAGQLAQDVSTEARLREDTARAVLPVVEAVEAAFGAAGHLG